MTQRLLEKVAIITGATTRSGRAIAYRFAKEGARLVVCGPSADEVDKVVRTIGRAGAAAVGFAGDVSQDEAAGACVEKALEVFGRVDVLVNGTGIATGGDGSHEVSGLPAHVRAALLMTRYALPHLAKTRGSIISTGSASGLGAEACDGGEAGTEAWIHALMRSVAAEYGQHGVRANCVYAAPVEAAAFSQALDAAIEETLSRVAPPVRQATARQIAELYSFLASSEAEFVSGALFVMDSGVPVTPSAEGRRRSAA